jgi:hypothetical protein
LTSFPGSVSAAISGTVRNATSISPAANPAIKDFKDWHHVWWHTVRSCANWSGAALILALALTALLPALPVQAKMDTAAEQEYRETMQAGRALEKSKDFARAKEKFIEAGKLARQGEDHKKAVDALAATGSVHMEEGDYSAA